MIDKYAPDIQLVDIRLLAHHPKNPRSDLGDLKELTESIRRSGVLQNLTVVARTDGTYGYWVLIGNRRLEAARAAGMEALPCVFCEMSEAEQIATMMTENMQRSDLTLTDQAGGVQMMMDLGLSVKDIARETGLSRTTIDRRAKLLKYDRGVVEYAFQRGGTLMDFMALEKVEDEERRKNLAVKIGTKDFRADLSSVLAEQKNRMRREAICQALDVFATRMTAYGELNGRTLQTEYVRSITLDEDPEAIRPPEDVKERRYYYYVSHGVTLYRERLPSDGDRRKAEQEAQERQHELMRHLHEERIARMKEITERHRALRREFVENLGDVRRARGRIFDTMVAQLGAGDGSAYLYKPQLALISEMTGIRILTGEHQNSYLDQEQLMAAIEEDPDRTALLLLYGALDAMDSGSRYYDTRYVMESGYSIHVGCHKESTRLDRLYALLVEGFSYPLSHEERMMQTGEHPVFGPVEG